MEQFTHTIKNQMGLDTKNAGTISRECEIYTSKINISLMDKKANAKQIADLTELGAEKGDKITVTADGVDEKLAAYYLERLVNKAL